jgi:excisionase family DNA binding protein
MVAARLHVSQATAYRLARAGTLPGAARVGRSWRVDARRLDESLFDSDPKEQRDDD